MDPVTSAQYLNMKDSFAREGIDIEIAYTPAGDIDYLYAVGRLLAVDREDNIDRLQRALPRLRRLDTDDEPVVGDLVLFSIDQTDEGYLSVPDALELIDEHIRDNPTQVDGTPWVSPLNVMHITKLCPAGEPEVPSGYPTQPWPAPSPAGNGRTGVRILVVDTGYLEDLDLGQYPWLSDVSGEPDVLGPILPNGERSIPQYAGHGTFAAGVAKCMAPGAVVYVGNHFTKSGGELEHVIIAKLEQLIRDHSPDVVCLPAGTYTRNNWDSLSFSEFHRRHEDLVLVASAGNDSTDRPFYPAAASWVVGVGALATDQRHRAWFSNYGASADVFALGEGVVNAYATGEYTYHEPPKQPAKQHFDGMARWDGTSYSAPLVAGLIADEMARSGASAQDATHTVLDKAKKAEILGVGPVARR